MAILFLLNDVLPDVYNVHISVLARRWSSRTSSRRSCSHRCSTARRTAFPWLSFWATASCSVEWCAFATFARAPTRRCPETRSSSNCAASSLAMLLALPLLLPVPLPLALLLLAYCRHLRWPLLTPPLMQRITSFK